MPELRIRYEDDSDRMPHEAIAEIVRTTGTHLAVTELEWTRDDDLPDKVVTIRPDTSGLETALSEASIDAAWRRFPGVVPAPRRTGRGA